MKKGNILICLILLCATLLAACNTQIDLSTPATTAEQASERMDAQMAALQSYRADVAMDFVLYAQGTKMRGELTSIVIEDAGKGIGNYYSYTEIRNVMTIDNVTKITISSIDAYNDGIAYASYTYNRTPRKLCSKMTPANFREYRQGDSDIIDFGYTDCQSTTFAQTDTGYTLSCSGYSADAMHAMAVATGIADLIDDTLQDMQVTLTLDKDYLPTEILLELTFDSEKYYKDTPPYFRMVIEFSEYNAAEHIIRTIEPEDYTMIKDLRLLKELDQMIADTLDQKKGSFTRETVHNVTFGKETNTTSQVDVTASFTNTKEGFSFQAEIEDGDIVATKVTYSNGDMIGLPAPDGSKINRMTDEQAKQELLTLINDPSFGYAYTRVINIEKTKTGYLVTMMPPNNGVVDQLSDALGVNMKQSSETIEFVLKRGKLVKLIHSFDASTTLSGQTLQYQGSIIVAFE